MVDGTFAMMEFGDERLVFSWGDFSEEDADRWVDDAEPLDALTED